MAKRQKKYVLTEKFIKAVKHSEYPQWMLAEHMYMNPSAFSMYMQGRSFGPKVNGKMAMIGFRMGMTEADIPSLTRELFEGVDIWYGDPPKE